MVYTKQEASKLQEEFWTTFGKYISPVPSAEGLKINWVNYKTGVKDVKFYMEADAKKATIGIKLLHPDAEIQQIFFEEFGKIRTELEQHVGEAWEWALHTEDNGKIISKIYKELKPANVFNKEDYPAIISFLKPRIISLDAFWNEWKYGFEEML